jgi:hypothetical protein
MGKQERPNKSGQRAATSTERPEWPERPPATETAKVHRLWLTRVQAMEAQGCSARTLRRRAQSGEVERRREGVHTLYRIPNLDSGQSGQIEQSGQKMATPSRVATVLTRAATPPKMATLGRASDPSELVAVRVLVDRLEEQALTIAQLQAQTGGTPGEEVEALRRQVAQLEEELEGARAEVDRWRARISRWKRKLFPDK